MSSASRGVRSRPPEEDIVSSSKTVMIPLLSSTMESNMLKESWIIPKMKPGVTLYSEDNNQFPVWEEDFQDLSGWCMDKFPEQCDFPVGEAINPKLSDTRYENEVSTLKEEVPEGFTIVYDEKRNFDDDILHIADLSDLQPVIKYEDLKHTNIAANKPDLWLNVTTTNTTTSNSEISTNTTAATTSSTSGQIKSKNLKLHIPSYHVPQVKAIDPLEPAILSALDSNEQEPFDLLSYLCDDETSLPSANTSTISPNILETKVKLIKEATVVHSPSHNKETKFRGRRHESNKARNQLKQPKNISSSSSSSSSSSYLEESIKLSDRIIKPKHNSNSAKLVNDYYKKKRRGVKRMLESDSEDHEHSDSSYRESREKNNEASRKSRMNKKAKEMEMAARAVQLEKDNRVLKMKVEELEKLVTTMRMTLLQTALKKER